jgi:WhiB family transcriptional regulator, redox-sensing transcriptional regulator
VITKTSLIAGERSRTSRSTSYRQGDPWWQRGLCRDYDPDLWFPSAERANAYSFPRKVCRTCPVKRQCLEEALRADHRYGMFGGLTPGERDKLRQQRAA